MAKMFSVSLCDTNGNEYESILVSPVTIAILRKFDLIQRLPGLDSLTVFYVHGSTRQFMTKEPIGRFIERLGIEVE